MIIPLLCRASPGFCLSFPTLNSLLLPTLRFWSCRTSSVALFFCYNSFPNAIRLYFCNYFFRKSALWVEVFNHAHMDRFTMWLCFHVPLKHPVGETVFRLGGGVLAVFRNLFLSRTGTGVANKPLQTRKLLFSQERLQSLTMQSLHITC